MTPHDLERIRQHPDFIQLVRRKQRLTWSLTGAMLVIYYGFVLLVAFAPACSASPSVAASPASACWWASA